MYCEEMKIYLSVYVVVKAFDLTLLDRNPRMVCAQGLPAALVRQVLSCPTVAGKAVERRGKLQS